MSITPPEKFQSLVKSAFEKWTPGSKYTFLKELKGGKSGAFVLLVDIAPLKTVLAKKNLSGHFILKLDKLKIWKVPEPNEYERHNAAIAQNEAFAEQHIPKLIQYKEEKGYTALLYEIAGLSLYNVITADTIDAGTLERRCSQLALTLLQDFNASYTVESGISPIQSLQNWLGYRLDRAEAQSLHEFIDSETAGRGAFIIGGRLLINPLWLCTAEALENDSSQSRFIGLLHGDLHVGNLLLDRQRPDSDRFWLIDFALSRKSPLFYDHAYFELSLLLRHLQGTQPERIISILEALDADVGTPAALRVPTWDVGISNCLRSMRSAAEEWQRKEETNRRDAFVAQQLLARVAVSLNWVNKDLAEGDRRLALTYGAWAADRYLKLMHEEEYQRVASQADTRLNTNMAVQEGAEEQTYNHELWGEVWEAMGGFDEHKSKFMLVSGKIKIGEDTASLGFLPWAAVIDLDPDSNESGLYSVVSEVLKKLRSVKQFGTQPQVTSFDRGTAWLMGNGWPSRNEPVPATDKIWRQDYIPHIEALCETIRRSVNPQKVKVLVLPSNGLEGRRLQTFLETVERGLKDLAEVFVLGKEEVDEELITRQFDMRPEDFVAGVRSIYGTNESVKEPEVPGLTGPVSIPIARLRNLEEDLDILHSKILLDETAADGTRDGFWRGSPPSWADLQAGIDIERDIHPQLIESLEKLLNESSNRTLELRHSPGAGGTTAALRAGWTLRTKYPTAILRRTSKLMLDRIDELFQLSQLPVLLIADSSVLGSQGREDLYHGFADRNARVVILHVNRVIPAAGLSEHPLTLPTPMDENEAEKFREAFAERTTDNKKRQQLARITAGENEYWLQCRLPFFYGLITYDRQFTHVEGYVESLLADASYGVRKVMRYLALVTRYAQIGISEPLFKRFLGLEANSRVTLQEVIGWGPTNLIQQQNQQIRLLHPVIGEEVLRQLLGGQNRENWDQGLKDLVVEFIRETARLLGNEAEELDRLFTQLFIRRDDWFRTANRRRFSELIHAIPTSAGQHQVFQLLTEVCPLNGHYWNHLGRHHIYEMKLDFAEAEQYLEKAIELDPTEKVHHHSLGMVLRFWVEDTLNKLFSESSYPSGAEALEAVRHLYDDAAQCFSEARELDPRDDHGYITHIQLIIFIAIHLNKAAGSADETEPQLSKLSREWMAKNIPLAETLLGQVRQLRADNKPSKYELGCVGGLDSIYGKYDETIAHWSALLGAFSEQSDLRRSLAYAYHARRKRRWDAMQRDELARIVDLMESNLHEDPTNDRDIRMWFQAYRRLPQFDYFDAINRLNAWATRSEAGDAYYYLYILNFLLWRSGRVRDETQIKKYLELCGQSATAAKKGHSYEWLGKEPAWCPVVHYEELGTFDRQINFYPHADKLVFVQGTIESIKGPKAGTIRLGTLMRAFFVPGTKFRESNDINAIVHFYVGFAYEGLRAWSVDFGPPPDAQQ